MSQEINNKENPSAFNLVVDKQRARFILMLVKGIEKNPEAQHIIMSSCHYLKINPVEDFLEEFFEKCESIGMDKDEEFIKLTSIQI